MPWAKESRSQFSKGNGSAGTFVDSTEPMDRSSKRSALVGYVSSYELLDRDVTNPLEWPNEGGG